MIRMVENYSELRAILNDWREKGESVGFVPTMGALHDGHLALVKESQKRMDRTVVSIFINPLQFGPHEGLGKYPRMPKADRKVLDDMGCDLLYVPNVNEMYNDGYITKIDPGPLANILEGAHRPKHFIGVATVMMKFLMQIMPDAVFFGNKDYQQLLIIKQIVRDLFIPVEVVGVPIAREQDGLAYSTRNAFLPPEQRKRAVVLFKTLNNVAELLRFADDIEDVLNLGRAQIDEAGLMLEYLELRDAVTLEPVRKIIRPCRLLVAAKLGSTRLLDNIGIEPVKMKEAPKVAYLKKKANGRAGDGKNALQMVIEMRAI